MKHHVYVIVHLETGRFYVGKAKCPQTRWGQHLRGTSKRRSYIQRAIKKHGADAFVMLVVASFEAEADAFASEREWIAKFQSNNERYGYNLSEGGEGNPGFDVTEETRKKLRENSLKRWARAGEKERNADMIRRVHTGAKRSSEARENMSQSQIGKVLSAAHRAKLSAATKGRPRPEISLALKGKPKSEEHKRKIANAHRGMKRSEEAKQNMRDAHRRRRERASAEV